MDENVDKLFSYYTTQDVKIKAWHLGFFDWCLWFAILCVIFFGIFVYGEGYLTFEQARGAIATHVRGDTVAVSRDGATRYFSAEDITYPGLENGNVFVATRQKVVRQRRDTCEDRTMPCNADSDCTVAQGGYCSNETGFCIEPSWCSVEEKPEIYELTVDDMFIWVKSSIQFVELASDKIYSTELDHSYPERGVNLFTVRDLLMMCKPVPVRYEEIKSLGAAIEVQFIWNCQLNRDQCTPEVSARRLDVLFDPHNIGYAFNYAEHISEDERVLNEMHGVRLFLRTYGRGRKFSFSDLVMKISTSFTLLALGPILTDLLMLKPGKLQKRYFARKYEESPNFSEHIESMRRRQQEQEQHQELDETEAEVQRRDQEWQRKYEED